MAEVPASGVRGPAFHFYLLAPLDSSVALWHRSQWEVAMKYIHAKVADAGGWLCLERYSDPLKTSDQLRNAGFFYDDDVVILDAKEFYRLIDGLDRTAE